MVRKCAANVTSLDLRMNPVACARGYRNLALRRLRRLALLDGAEISAADRAAARAAGADVPHAELLAACTFPYDGDAAALHDQQAAQPPSSAQAGSDDAQQGEQSELANDISGQEVCGAIGVNLAGRQLRRLDCIAKLTALSWAHVADNELTTMQGLEACAQLTRLDASVRLSLSENFPCSEANARNMLCLHKRHLQASDSRQSSMLTPRVCLMMDCKALHCSMGHPVHHILLLSRRLKVDPMVCRATRWQRFSTSRHSQRCATWPWIAIALPPLPLWPHSLRLPTLRSATTPSQVLRRWRR